jgi:hypothetical protein
MEQNLITKLIYCCAVEEILSKYILFFLWSLLKQLCLGRLCHSLFTVVAYNAKRFVILPSEVNAFKWLLHFMQTHSSKLRGGNYLKTNLSSLSQYYITEQHEF